MNQINISVIIPIYNAEKYLYQCIESVLNQTYKFFEIILVNDGSSDNSLKIINEFKEKDNRIVVYNQENKGVGSARNLGLKKAQGKYIYFMDSDDYIHPTLLDKLISYSIQNKLDLVACNGYSFNGNNYKNLIWHYETNVYDKRRYRDLFINSEIINGDKLVVVWNKLFCKDIIKKNNIKFTDKVLEDYLFVIEYSKFVNNYGFLKDQLYYYRILDNSLTKKFNYNIFSDLLYVENIKQKYIASDFYQSNLPNDIKYNSYKWFIKYSLNIIYLVFRLKSNLNIIEKHAYLKTIVECDVLQKYVKYVYFIHKEKTLMNKLILNKSFKAIYLYYYFKACIAKIKNRFKG